MEDKMNILTSLTGAYKLQTFASLLASAFQNIFVFFFFIDDMHKQSINLECWFVSYNSIFMY